MIKIIHNKKILYKEIQSSDLVTLWAIEKTAGKEMAMEYLNEQLTKHSDNKYLLWVKAMFENGKLLLSENEKGGAIRVVESLIKLEECLSQSICIRTLWCFTS